MLFEPAETEFCRAFSRYSFLNPIDHPDTEALRAQLLTIDIGLDAAAAKRPTVGVLTERPFVDVLVRRAEALIFRLQERMRAGRSPAGHQEVDWYYDLVTNVLFSRFFEDRTPLVEAGDGTGKVKSFARFAALFRELVDVTWEVEFFFREPAHPFAVFFQLRRSYEQIVTLIQGASRPIVRLRAAIWNSIFPHELRLYGSLLYSRMRDVTTLILGPSGTGKELVATAIGLSRYIPFDAQKQRFSEPLAGAFHPVNLSAMPAELIESEVFGHCVGAFTGAVRDRAGWFERCAPGHTVFLDEIGELAAAVQVKLLRVLQNREFYRVGETEPRSFQGRVIAATNRDLEVEIVAGRFREDLFFRLCSDVIRTPSLREQLDDRPDDLAYLVRLIAARTLGERAWPEQIEWLTNLTCRWIETSPELGGGYPWPGNFRELEQCVRSMMVRGEYHPALGRLYRRHTSPTGAPIPEPGGAAPAPALDQFLARVRAGELTFEELLRHYCSLIYSRSPNLTEAARRLDKHRATVEGRVDPALVEAFRGR